MSLSRFLLIIPLVAALSLPACMEGDFVGGATVQVQTVEGIWNGSGNFVGGGNLVGMIHDGQFTIVQLVQGTLPVAFYVGQYNANLPSGPRPGEMTIYNGSGGLDVPSLNTTITPAATLNIQAGGERQLLPLSLLADFYDRPADPSFLDGNWEDLGASVQDPLTLSFVDGNFNGNDGDGCNYIGNAVVPDPQVNIYRVVDLDLTALTPNACDRQAADGSLVSLAGNDYQGFIAFFDQTANVRQLLWMIVANGENAFLLRLQRL